MNKIRLILNGKVVGYQESRFAKEWGEGLFIYQSIDGREWSLLSFGGPPHAIAHDAEDRSTGETDSKGVDVYENDKISYNDLLCDSYILDKAQSRTVGVVRWIAGKCGFRPQEVKENSKGGHYIALWDMIEDIKVIGRVNNSP